MSPIVTKIKKSKKKRKFQPAYGIRRKIRYGFVILGCLLLFAGIISYFEFSRLSRTTSELMSNSLRDLDISKRMLEAMTHQNAALFMQVYDSPAESVDPDSLFNSGWVDFDETFAEAKALDLYTNKLERISEAKVAYDEVLRAPALNPEIDSLFWYNYQYKIAYFDLALTVKDFMIDSQNKVDQNALTVQSNAYRAIMPGIITLVIAIIIILVFYILINDYYIRPVLKMKQGLDGYLNARIPYTVQIEGKDETRELSEHIETLITLARKKDHNI